MVDFDLFAATSRDSSDAAWREVREACPVAWTERNGGHWIVSGYEEVATAFRDWEHFSSARTNPKYCAITLGDSLLPLLTPEEIDPPDWYPLRRILARAALAQGLRDSSGRESRTGWRTAVDEVIESGRCDFVHDLAVPGARGRHARVAGLPAERLAHDLGGLPRHRGVLEGQSRVRSGERGVPAGAGDGSAKRSTTAGASHATTRMTAIAYHEIDGERIPKEVAESIVFMTVGGGVDTTTSLIGAALLHLCQFPDDRRRLLEEPDLLATATEEFLRFYPPARTHARTVAADVEFAGCPMRKGDRVVLSEISAGHDEDAFPDAESLRDRPPSEPAPVVRHGHPPLPGLAPGAHRVHRGPRRDLRRACPTSRSSSTRSSSTRTGR